MLAAGLLQALAAVVLVVVLALVGFYALFADTRKAILGGNGTRVKTSLVAGVIDASTAPAAGYTYDTQNELMPNYVPVRRSFNRLGGAELSYAFWMFKAERVLTTEAATSAWADDGLKATDAVLLLKGNPLLVATTSQAGRPIKDVITKCPLVKLDGSTDRLTVEFNTSEDRRPNDVVEGARVDTTKAVDTRSAYASKVSIFGLNDPKFVGRWFHVAVVLRDNDPVNDRNRHIQARIFVNGEGVFDRTVSGSIGDAEPVTLRQNDGFVYVLPAIRLDATATHTTLTGDIKTTPGGTASVNLRLADVWHANYALDEDEVKKLHQRGITKQKAAAPASLATAAGGGSAFLLSDVNAWKRVQTA